MKNNIIIKEKPTTKEVAKETIKRCSSFDKDCSKVETPHNCFLGYFSKGNLGITDGYCPKIHNSN